MIKQIVCNATDLREGELKEFDLGPGKVLLSKVNGQISAVSSKCTHYGAPLITGAYKNGKVRCPWHGACFSTITGDIEDFPGLDCLQAFKVEVNDGKVIVIANEESLINFRRVKSMDGYCSENKNIILILGGGVSALICAETLRQEGYQGEIIMATKESHVPYDRTKLSKALNTKASDLYLRDINFLNEKGIIMAFNKLAVSVDIIQRKVLFADHSFQSYTKLFIATGSQPRHLDIPGNDLENIFYLRTPENANDIDSACINKDIVILGSGFIGMELACYFINKAKSVSVVGRTSVPFEKLLGERVGKSLKMLHIAKGVKFFESSIKELIGTQGKVVGVVLADGTVIKTDVVISGIGVSPSTEFLENSSVVRDECGFIKVDQFMRCNTDVYAGGDIVSFPYVYDSGKYINIGHWQVASAHGRYAALNMLEKNVPLVTVPFFWTSLYGNSLRYAGYCSSFDQILYEGNVEELKFVAYYCRDGQVRAVASMNCGAKASEMAFKIESGDIKPPDNI
ncbi:apoptosis-inducing factor 3 isoform X2 [Hydra vulgaris]|uniref:Apoptosis-inducing factor 3 isoform X2 n=1 Tax=Hydra vulgaris TaxID=6087 RepID=A0ABM4BDH8_HYDVU